MTALTVSRSYIGNILSKHLEPAIENVDCSAEKQVGLENRGHKLAGVCYQFFGKISRIALVAHLNCHSSNESVDSKLFGTENAPSLSENVAVDVEVAADCHLDDVKVEPAGDLGKSLVAAFDTNGEARRALEDGLAEFCKP